jgi:hypothetical protein
MWNHGDYRRKEPSASARTRAIVRDNGQMPPGGWPPE